MGAVARKLGDERPVARVRPRLVVIAAGDANSSRSRRAPRGARVQRANSGARRTSRAVRSSRAVAAFRLFVCVAVIGACAGFVRVAIAAQVAEAAVDAVGLQKDIKAEQLEADALEAVRGELAAPSRIESIASASMQMTTPESVRYLELPGDSQDGPLAEEGNGASSASTVAAGSNNRSGPFAALLDTAAGEAQVLLIGDVGLSSAR